METPASQPFECSRSPVLSGERSRRSLSHSRRRSALWAGLLLVLIVGVLTGARYAVRWDPLREAHRARASGDDRRALRLALEQLKSRPADPAASLLAARCLTRLGQGRQAEEYYKAAGPLGLEDAHDRAYALVLAGQSEQAAEVYFEMIQRWPDDVLALKRLAGVLMELKAWKPALLVAERLIRVPEGEVAGQTLAGIGYHVSRHADQAATAFERVLELDPQLREMPLPHTLFWNHLALDLLALGRTAEARCYLERALAEKDDAGLRELLGVTFEKEGSPDEAEACWRRALLLDPDNADTLLDLGRLALARSRLDEAQEMFERAIALVPNSVDPAYNLSRVYRLRGDIPRAQEYERLAARLRQAQPPRGGMGEMPDEDMAEDSTAASRQGAPR